ncbi:MAG: TSUP family transporter, partial [Chloroflexota bacterium]|nr:TSUP family transporter [Chloroflexota bacterium]
LVLGIGIFMLVRRGRHGVFSWKGLIGIGLLSSFNKGISGGGYGPLITGGQIISGREVRSSVGSTTLGEVVVCVVGLLGYVLIAKVDVFWTLAAATSIGSLVAAPFAAVTVKKISPENLELAIALITIVLGALTLAKTYIF